LNTESGLFGRYVKLLEAAKDVDQFTKYVVEQYDKLHRQLQSSCNAQPSGDADTRQQSKATDRLALIYTCYAINFRYSSSQLDVVLSSLVGEFASLCSSFHTHSYKKNDCSVYSSLIRHNRYDNGNKTLKNF